MISGGIEVSQFTEICLILQAKFADVFRSSLGPSSILVSIPLEEMCMSFPLFPKHHIAFRSRVLQNITGNNEINGLYDRLATTICSFCTKLPSENALEV